MQQVIILGSTGSIGTNTLDVIRLNKERYQVFALICNTQIELILKQCIEFKPQYAVILNNKLAVDLQAQMVKLGLDTIVFDSMEDVIKLVQDPSVDIVMSAIVGAAGLQPTYMALKSGKKVLLANKESLITGGQLIIDALNSNEKAQLIPVDSEHSAIFQSLPHDYNRQQPSKYVNKIILTASGGPFRSMPYVDLQNVTPQQAIKHPNWKMGQKISIDSATLMNKGLEVIEAYWLFGINLNKIDVVIHPQSIIHSMVEYIDGSIIAQMGTADMKCPIAYAMAYPQRIESGCSNLDFTKISSLTFEKPDLQRFPCLELAFIALESGGIAPAVVNAANEIAVAEFLNNKIRFYDIPHKIEKAMHHFGSHAYSSIAEIIEIDQSVRKFSQNLNY